MNNLFGGGISLALLEKIREMHEFSFKEKCVGTWIDGKPLYRKMIDFGTLPTGRSKTVPVEVADEIDFGLINFGASYFYYTPDPNNATYALMNANNVTQVYYSKNKNAVGISTSSALTDGNDYKAIICLEYTKTID